MPASTDIFPAQDAKAITPNDTPVDTSPVFRALYVGTTGDITFRTSRYTSSVTLKSVPVGILPINCQWVYATGTTAANLVGCV
jgi:hypothetical protein